MSIWSAWRTASSRVPWPCTAEDPDQAAEEMEEERRLCYVGITRAMKKLSLSCARSRFRNGEHQFNRPSRFISEIPRYLLHMQAATLLPPPPAESVPLSF